MTDTPTADGPLIAESSKVFALLSAVTLAVAGVAGIVNDPPAPAHVARAGHAEPAGDGGHHPGPAPASGDSGHDDHSAAAPAPEGDDAGHADHSAASAGSVMTAEHAEHAEHDDAEHTGADHDDAEHTGTDHGGGTTHGAHAGCADDHPATVALVEKVQFSLEEIYPDIATLMAKGYIPYFDAFFPGGYPPGGEGISHWIRPPYIEDGVVLDPLQPETVLLDDWWNPIGMMFISDPNQGTRPVYVNDDGTACSPWHPHTDYPARFGWWFYRVVYDDAAQSGDVGLPDQTPEMMHVWAVPNPRGVYEAHNYPPQSSRKGGPEPGMSYFRD